MCWWWQATGRIYRKVSAVGDNSVTVPQKQKEWNPPHHTYPNTGAGLVKYRKRRGMLMLALRQTAIEKARRWGNRQNTKRSVNEGTGGIEE